MKNTKSQELVEKFADKQIRNLYALEKIEPYLSEKGFIRFSNCATYLNLIATKNLKNKKVIRSNYCHNRYCVICSWIKARKDNMIISTLMMYIHKEHKKEFVFLTLTIPNMPASEVIEGIDLLQNSFRKLQKRKEFLKINQGYIRKLEMTYNKDENTYHPHLHVLVAVNKSYFKSRDYMSVRRLLELWQEVTDDKTITQVKIQKVENKATEDKVTNELSKYVAKDEDFIKHNDEVFNTFYTALKGRQLITYNGLFKEALKLYKADDIEIKPYKFKDKNFYEIFIQSNWDSFERKYFENHVRELTDEELDKYNKED